MGIEIENGGRIALGSAHAHFSVKPIVLLASQTLLLAECPIKWSRFFLKYAVYAVLLSAIYAFLVCFVRILPSRTLSACRVLSVKEFLLNVTLIDAFSGVQLLVRWTGETDSCPILGPLLACKAVGRARLALQSGIIEPLASWASLI